MGIHIREHYVNATTRSRFGDSESYDTHFDARSELFRFCLKEYGRCISKMYVDHSFYGTLCVGWVFQKRKQYDDCKDTYLQETWVELTDRLNNPERRKRGSKEPA
jgi:hypothetical protein